MFFSKKKKALKSSFRRLYNRYSRLMSFAIVFSLGIVGTNIFYKNQSVATTSQQGSSSAEVEMVTSQLNNEKDLTDSLSSKNLELKQQLKEALSKVSGNDENAKVTSLTSELKQEKQNNQKLNDENARLKVRINSMLATIEATKNTSESNIAKVESNITEGGRNVAQDSKLNIETAKNKNFNKVKMASSDNNLTADKAESSTKSRNSTRKVAKADEDETEPQKVVSSNKVRTMKLKKGESLWNLSKRAYGKGVYYKRIIKANPSITEKSFKKLRPGAEINVPR